jgi:hypothetical protein
VLCYTDFGLPTMSNTFPPFPVFEMGGPRGAEI